MSRERSRPISCAVVTPKADATASTTWSGPTWLRWGNKSASAEFTSARVIEDPTLNSAYARHE